MSTDPRDQYVARVRQLSALLRGIENLDQAAAIISSATSEQDAIDRLAAALDLSPEQCRPIIDMRLGQLLPANVTMLRQELTDLTERLGEA